MTIDRRIIAALAVHKQRKSIAQSLPQPTAVESAATFIVLIRRCTTILEDHVSNWERKQRTDAVFQARATLRNFTWPR